MKRIGLGILFSLLAVLGLGCGGGRECTSHVTEGSQSQHCDRECLRVDKYYKCSCDRNCKCWDSH